MAIGKRKGKTILFSGNQEEPLIKKLIKALSNFQNLKIYIHNPIKNAISLEGFFDIKDRYELVIAKVAGKSSIDLLYAAKLNHIPTLNKYDSVLLCKNKIALDTKLRSIFSNHQELKKFYLPRSWLHPSPLRGLRAFKNWASDKLPLVFKSHDQHNEFYRFNFLAKTRQEIDDFILQYKDFLYFDLYIQEFIECDGIDRKIYVCGDNIYGVKRENPIYIYLREHPEDIDVKTIKRESYEVNESIKRLASILSRELELDIFGFDLVKPLHMEGYFLLDLNDFPGFQGVPNADVIIKNYIKKYLEKL
jgi:glutathione synthase/RimK-type ligase-like ATP-grasp enzyme